ncbi:DUF2125 domain-containing protein [Celeribacter halophilus]|uniref:DUF2125 domain-containing protein n=1 Tax=Celeribacter halophilus TaxID=576117 RepID=UPI001C09DC07|nr:DUF2125 domain-containing protein [Celeribacter halophilus]MBU2890212.1 DUF2125 domain-containing protein [Celeribacter halophilus]MDO6509895.1 DUF2125 domain-containing protein [Celeribacter halophilus]
MKSPIHLQEVKMRKLFWLLLAAVVIYSGYWMIGAKGTESAIAAWIDSRASEGWQAEVADIKTRGFPTRFDTEIREPQLADPRTGVALSTPRIEILSQSHRPTRFTLRMAPEVTLASPYQRLDITQDLAEAQLFVDPGPSLTLDHAALSLQNMRVASTATWGFTLESGEITTQRQADDPLTHDIALHVEGFAPTGGLIDGLDPKGLLSDRFEALDLDMQATFDGPWNIHALEGPRPQPTHIDLTTLSAHWGELDLKLAGAFDINARGYPVGKLAIKAENWREMIELAISVGAIPENMSNLTLRAGEMLAGLSGRKDTIDAELTLKDGMISLGFIPLGPAPRIVIR